MFEFLWWAFITAVGIGIGVYLIGLQGALFMALIGAIGGGVMWFDKQNRP